jgi:hypothetical protein
VPAIRARLELQPVGCPGIGSRGRGWGRWRNCMLRAGHGFTSWGLGPVPARHAQDTCAHSARDLAHAMQAAGCFAAAKLPSLHATAGAHPGMLGSSTAEPPGCTSTCLRRALLGCSTSSSRARALSRRWREGAATQAWSEGSACEEGCAPFRLPAESRTCRGQGCQADDCSSFARSTGGSRGKPCAATATAAHLHFGARMLLDALDGGAAVPQDQAHKVVQSILQGHGSAA